MRPQLDEIFACRKCNTDRVSVHATATKMFSESLVNDDVADLYDRVSVGTHVIVRQN
jgi:transcription elongation factor Elf1